MAGVGVAAVFPDDQPSLPPPAKRRRVAKDHGPLVFVAVVGNPDGHGHEALRALARCSSRERGPLLDALRVQAACYEPALLGFIVVRSWSLVKYDFSNGCAAALAGLLHSAHRRQQHLGFVEHEIIAVAKPGREFPLHAVDGLLGCSSPDGEVLSQLCSCERLIGTLPSIGARDSFDGAVAWIAAWAPRVIATGGSVAPLRWDIHPALAQVLLRGDVCSSMVTAVPGRSTTKSLTLPLPVPPRRMRAFKEWLRQQRGQLGLSARSQPGLRCSRAHPRQIHSEQHLINALVMLKRRSHSDAEATSVAALQYMFPDRWQAIKQELASAGLRHPGKNPLDTALVRLDLAAMLLWRQWAKSEYPFFRYVNFDASPQNGTEVFGSSERVLRVADVVNASPSVQPLVVETRRLPLVYLGQSHLSLADKVSVSCTRHGWSTGPRCKTCGLHATLCGKRCPTKELSLVSAATLTCCPSSCATWA